MSNRTRSFKYVRVVRKSFVFLAANRMLNHLVVCDLIAATLLSYSFNFLIFENNIFRPFYGIFFILSRYRDRR